MRKPRTGKVVSLGIALCASGTIGYSIPQIQQVPKLEQSISILRDENALQKEQNKRLDTERVNLHIQVEKMSGRLDVFDARNKELQKEIELQKQEIERLKKARAKPVMEPSPSGVFASTLSDFQVTWYNGAGITKSGNPTKDGVTVSVDPRVIPLGTWIRIDLPNGETLTRRAEDTGGAVKGRILDVYANVSTTELRQRGRTRGVTVHIMK